MNTRENILRILSMLLIVGGVVLQVTHTAGRNDGRLFTLFGFLLSLMVYVNYAGRLKAENAELRRQLATRK